MNYELFRARRSEILRETPEVIDGAEMNLYSALAPLVASTPDSANQRVHRCHLAAEWTTLFGLPLDMSKRALVSCGIRDSLARLFDYYARRGARVWLPADTYPVFLTLAEEAKLLVEEYTTLPTPSWPSDHRRGREEIILLTNPMKPLGRWLTPEDVTTLKVWLSVNSRRRLLIDTVYTYGTAFHESTLELVRGEQSILLHSLTKGWLRPRLFGVAVLPLADLPALAPAFRLAPPIQSNLAEARWLMSAHQARPGLVRSAIDAASQSLRLKYPHLFPARTKFDSTSYFCPIKKPWDALLVEDRLLGIPVTVFGSKREDITIISSLSFIK
jgi:hypothetical protein